MAPVHTATPSDPETGPWRLPSFQELLKLATPQEIVCDAREWLLQHPLSHEGFALLGEACEAVGELGASIIAFQRALHLQRHSRAYRPSDALSRLLDLEAVANGTPALTLGEMEFPRLVRSRREDRVNYTARSRDGHEWIKIAVASHQADDTALSTEGETLETLTAHGCLTSPRLLERGTLSLEKLRAALPENERNALSNSGVSAQYLITEYLPAASGYGIADVALALLELKRCGLRPGRLTPDSIRFDARSGICRFIDFKEAEWLSEEMRSMKDRDYFVEYNQRVAANGSAAHFLAGFPHVDLEKNFWPLFDGERFRLTRTYPFQAGRVSLEGIRSVSSLAIPGLQLGPVDASSGPILSSAFERIPFAHRESVLVLNSPMSLHAIALAERDCRVTAADLDPSDESLNRIVERMLRVSVDHVALDLDHLHLAARFETILLCGSSETEIAITLTLNGARFSQYCRRVLIETPAPSPDSDPVEAIRTLLSHLPDFELSQTYDCENGPTQWVELVERK